MLIWIPILLEGFQGELIFVILFLSTFTWHKLSYIERKLLSHPPTEFRRDFQCRRLFSQNHFASLDIVYASSPTKGLTQRHHKGACCDFFPFALRIKQFAELLSLARVEPFNEVSNSVGSKRDKRVISSGILTLLDEMRGAKRVYGRILLFSSKIHHGWARLPNINNFWGFECFRKGFFLIKAKLWDDPLSKSLMEDLRRANQWRDLRFAC